MQTAERHPRHLFVGVLVCCCGEIGDFTSVNLIMLGVIKKFAEFFSQNPLIKNAQIQLVLFCKPLEISLLHWPN